jgi:REP element-mobilizing transposase RayT
LVHRKFVDEVVRHWARACGVRIYEIVNVGNHLHLVIKISDVNSYKKFIRIITARIARHIGQRERGPARANKWAPSDFQFWLGRPFTRIIEWGRDWDNLLNYMIKNLHQAGPDFWEVELSKLYGSD